MTCLCQQCQHKTIMYFRCTRKLTTVHWKTILSALKKNTRNRAKKDEKTNAFFCSKYLEIRELFCTFVR